VQPSAAVHGARGAVATPVHHAYVLALQQRAIEAGSAWGLPSEESDPMRVPLGVVGRVTLSLGCGTSTARAKRLAFASASIFMQLCRREILLRDAR
jgi:hypothetical protein